LSAGLGRAFINRAGRTWRGHGIRLNRTLKLLVRGFRHRGIDEQPDSAVDEGEAMVVYLLNFVIGVKQQSQQRRLHGFDLITDRESFIGNVAKLANKFLQASFW